MGTSAVISADVTAGLLVGGTILKELTANRMSVVRFGVESLRFDSTHNASTLPLTVGIAAGVANGAQLQVSNSTAAQVVFRVDSIGTNDLARFYRGVELVASLSTNGFLRLASNTVAIPTAAQIGLGGTVFFNSNGTHWLARCLDGSTVETKSLW